MALRAKPLRQRSDRQAHKERALAAAKPELMRRSGGRCELCLDGREFALDPHHPFGRHDLGPWTNEAVCIVVACRPCHDVCTNPATPSGHALAEQAQHQVVARLRELARRRTPMHGCTLRLEAIRLTEMLGDPS